MDISQELNYYKNKFNNKNILCNCDNQEVDFTIYFSTNFNKLGLKTFTSIIHPGSLISKNSIKIPNYDNSKYYILDFSELGKLNISETIHLDKINEYLEDSSHITELNKESYQSFVEELITKFNMVVGNPEQLGFHTLFNNLINQPIDFLMLCNSNLVFHKLLFPYIKNEWVKVNLPLDASLNNFCWLSSFNSSNKEVLISTKEFNPESYPKYDNYNAIHSSRISDIPKDYSDFIGVPLSFLFKWNPEQFKLIDRVSCKINGKFLPRLIIRRITSSYF